MAERFSGPVRLKPRATLNYVTLELTKPGEFNDQHDLLYSRIIEASIDQMFFYTGPLPCELRTVLGIRDGDTGRHDVWLVELTDCIREATAHRRAGSTVCQILHP